MLPLLVPVLLAATEVSLTVAPGSECVTHAGLTARLQRAGLTVVPRSDRFGVSISWEGSTVHVRGLRRGASLDRDIAVSKADCAGLERVIVALIQSWSQSIPKAMGSREDAGVTSTESSPRVGGESVEGPPSGSSTVTAASRPVGVGVDAGSQVSITAAARSSSPDRSATVTAASKPVGVGVDAGAQVPITAAPRSSSADGSATSSSLVPSSPTGAERPLRTSVDGGPGPAADRAIRSADVGPSVPSSSGSLTDSRPAGGSSIDAGAEMVASATPVQRPDAGSLVVVSERAEVTRANTSTERRTTERSTESARLTLGSSSDRRAPTVLELGASSDGGTPAVTELELGATADGGVGGRTAAGDSPPSVGATASTALTPQGPTLDLSVVGGGALGPTSALAGVGQASAVLMFSRFGAMIDLGLESARVGTLSVESTSQWASLSGVIQFEPASRIRLRAGLGLRGFRFTGSAPSGVQDARSGVSLSWGAVASGEASLRIVGPLWAQLGVFGFARWRPEHFKVDGLGTVLELTPFGGGALLGLSVRGVGE